MTYTRPVVVDLGCSLIAHGTPATARVHPGPFTDRPRADPVDRPREPVVPVSRMLAALAQLEGLLRHDQRKDAA